MKWGRRGNHGRPGPTAPPTVSVGYLRQALSNQSRRRALKTRLSPQRRAGLEKTGHPTGSVPHPQLPFPFRPWSRLLPLLRVLIGCAYCLRGCRKADWTALPRPHPGLGGAEATELGRHCGGGARGVAAAGEGGRRAMGARGWVWGCRGDGGGQAGGGPVPALSPSSPRAGESPWPPSSRTAAAAPRCPTP